MPTLTPAKGYQILVFTQKQQEALPPPLWEWLRVRAWRNRIDHYSRRGADGKREYLSVIQLEVENRAAEAFLAHIAERPELASS